MGGRIADDAIQDIRDRTSLVELISEGTALRKRGRNYVGLCPFHAENTPSFTVSEERGFFHCFGCGASGNAFAWVMRTQQMAFPEAVRWLARRAGVELPTSVGDERDRRADDLLYRVNEEAQAYYQRVLWESAAGEAARVYLTERGVDEALARRFGLGFAPGSGEDFLRRVRSERIPIEAALTVGVLGRRNDGTVSDRFRGRLMFPIKDGSGRISGFGGRVLPGGPADAPKYLNSPESPIFKKRQLVYGLAEARETIRSSDRAILVEGYLDVMALHQYGLGSAVAPLGTSVTAEQLRQLRRYTGDVVACFDGDEAGARAAARSFATFVEAGLWGRAALLPAGEDPDSFVRAHGAAAFERIVADAVPLLDVFLRTLMNPGEASVTRRVQAAREVGRLLRRVRNAWEYDVLARRAAERLGVREESLRGEGARSAPSSGGGATQLGGGGATQAEPSATGEAMLIELMLTGNDAIERVDSEGGASLFEDAGWKTLAGAILERSRSAADPGALVEGLPPEMRSRVAAALLGGESEGADRVQLLEDCLDYIRRRRGRRRLRKVLEEIRAAEAVGDDVRVREGLQQWRALVGESEPTTPAGLEGGE